MRVYFLIQADLETGFVAEPTTNAGRIAFLESDDGTKAVRAACTEIELALNDYYTVNPVVEFAGIYRPFATYGSISVDEELTWTRFYREARERMAYHYGLRGIPVDAYKEHWFIGESVSVACEALWSQWQHKVGRI